MRAFARAGLHGTTVAAVADEAHISPAYVFKLFPSKERLFVAAVEMCFDEIVSVLEEAVSGVGDDTAESLLATWRRAYSRLLEDRTLLMLQVHAQSVATIPEIGVALREGLARLMTFIKTRSGGSDDAVRCFIAHMQLCHLVASADIDEIPDSWAMILTQDDHPPSNSRLSG